MMPTFATAEEQLAYLDLLYADCGGLIARLAQMDALQAESATQRAQLEALVFMVEAGFSSGRCPLCEPKYDRASGELYAHEDDCAFKGWQQQGIDLPKLVAHLAEIRADTDRAFVEVEAKLGKPLT